MNRQTKENQMKQTFQAFREEPRTMLQVAKITGILRANICRYVATFQKQNRITVVWEGPCPISKHQAQFYSTDPNHIPVGTQKELFEEA